MDDKLNIVTTFLHNIIVYNIPLLYGTVGEITIEKSGSLNLGVEGTMAVGAIFGYILGCYANSMVVGVLVAFLTAALCGLIFAVLTVTFQANQNITGLTITTFGLGVFFFVGNGVKAVSWPAMNNYSNIQNGFADLAIPGLSNIPVLGEVLFDHNVLVYLGVVNALVGYYMGLNMNGSLSSSCWINGYGWIAVALVIFANWSPAFAMVGTVVFGFFNTLRVSGPSLAMAFPGPLGWLAGVPSQLYQALPFIITALVLIATSVKKSKNSGQPAALGLNYFREER